MSKVTQDARQLNLPEEKLLGDWIVCIPGFTLEKYRELQNSHLSIFAMNCFGGLISNFLGISFRSPFINMFFSEKGYINFLRESQIYMEKLLTFVRTGYDSNLKRNYPIVKLGDVEIYMNHYVTFDAAVKVWNERKQRINWNNLFVTAYTESEDFLKEFEALPYGKKVCFVPFKSNLDSAWYLPNLQKDYWRTVNDFAKGILFFYDPFDMLLYGKKTPLINM